MQSPVVQQKHEPVELGRTPETLDDGSLSPFAVALAKALRKIGIETSVKSVD